MTTAVTRPPLDVRRADDRFKTHAGWLDSKHSFSFSRHYDPANTHHGVLMVNNDDIVVPGMGFDTHPHQDMEIVTWVLQGSLVHQDSMGHSGVIYPGLAQRMSAGTGILHSEKNDSWRLGGVAGAHADQHSDPVHFIQMWVVPDEAGITPGYEQLEIDHELLAGDWCRSRRACPRTPTTRRFGSRTSTPQCTLRACNPGRRRSPCPTRRSSMCSWRAVRHRWRASGCSARATPFGSAAVEVSN